MFSPTVSVGPRGLRTRFQDLLARRHGGVLISLFLFAAIALITRTALLARSLWSVEWDASLLAAFGWGTAFDLGAGLLAAIPLVLALTFLPAKAFARNWARVLAHAVLFTITGLLLFGAVAEWLFWDEFSVRFNFIAVDYLVYTTEVIANIRESYPMPLILAVLGLATAEVYAALLRTGLVSAWLAAPHEAAGPRYRRGAAWLALAVLAGLALDSNQIPAFPNTYNRELAKDGLWSLFASFRNNELDYDEFYSTLAIDEAFAKLRGKLSADGAIPLGDGRDTLRYVRNAGPELHLNVIQITVESLSADFLSTFNRASKLTPELGALAEHSLVFENLYATGTRTDRGMEALSLSLPPMPGRSLIKRPRNENLFTLGSVFRSRGYDTAFIYGGYGYFDNMNAFFGGNGYRVVDRSAVKDDDITFANAWGACDEDLYRWTLREADAAYAAGQPFHHFVMTTSNHRPYTYPEGKIDLPPKVSGRSGAVKYTDYAIGQFLRAAAAKPWFKNTVFVIVGDHCASVAGKVELPVQNYHIPLFIYAPGGQLPTGRVPDLMSQIDYAPTLLGLLNWSYASRFYGWDVRKATGDRRALLGNYQRLGLYEPGVLEVLKPMRDEDSYHFDVHTFALTSRENDACFRDEAIAYYQTASYLYKNGRYGALAVDEQRAAATAANGRVDRGVQTGRGAEVAPGVSLQEASARRGAQ
jgi:phosphoglycerol transferase MdoB-like AlkP superfamily enzyme